MVNNPWIKKEPTTLPDGSIWYGPHPKQQQFLLHSHTQEVFYGGAGAGGKSQSLWYGALQYVDVPGYSALILRRTYADLSLPSALMQRAQAYLAGMGVAWSGQTKTLTFPSGATITFGYLENEADKYRYASAEFQYCVAGGTPILMADGGYQQIAAVKPGMIVATLQGPRMVTRAVKRGVKKCYAIHAGGAEVVVSDCHRVLTPSGWRSILELQPSECREFGKAHGASRPPGSSACTLPASIHTDRQPLSSPVQPQHQETCRQATAAFSADGRTCYEASGDLHPASQLPQAWCVPVVLFERAIHPAAQGWPLVHPRGAQWHDRGDWSTQDSQPGCHAEHGSCGERFRGFRASDQERTPSPDDAAAGHLRGWLTGDLLSIPAHSRLAKYAYCHPYTYEVLSSAEAVHHTFAEIFPAGEAEVWDLTVEGASHYISFGGIISQNCAFDELTHFKESQYTFLFTRLRKLRGLDVPLRMRSASNPGGVGHDWVRKRFVDPGTRFPKAIFIPAKLEDNPSINIEEYDASLGNTDPVTRAQIRSGDWNAHAGGRFKASWFRRYIRRGDHLLSITKEQIPLEWLRDRFLTVDTAATEKTVLKPDPDYTVVSAWAHYQGQLIWLGCLRFQYEIPDIPPFVRMSYKRHRAGKAYIEGFGIGKGPPQLCKRLDPTMNVIEFQPIKDKLTNATNAMNMAEGGRIWIPADSGHWEWFDPKVKECCRIDDALSEIVRFTGDEDLDSHDDVVDTLAKAANVVTGAGGGNVGFAPSVVGGGR